MLEEKKICQLRILYPANLNFIKKTEGDFPGDPVVTIPLQGAGVPFLVGELRFPYVMKCSQKKKKKKKGLCMLNICILKK